MSLLPDFAYDPPAGDPVILFEDARLIVVDKPAGLLSVPGKLEGRADCLISRLQKAYWDALLVHRLDCDTSGVMIFARNKKAQGFLGQEFEQRRAHKTYIARVAGEVQGEAGRVGAGQHHHLLARRTVNLGGRGSIGRGGVDHEGHRKRQRRQPCWRPLAFRAVAGRI